MLKQISHKSRILFLRLFVQELINNSKPKGVFADKEVKEIKATEPIKTEKEEFLPSILIQTEGGEIPLPKLPTHTVIKPPTKKTVNSDHNPLKQVEVIYPRPLKQRHFWTPLMAIGGPAWDFGWLSVYIFSYLFVMLIVKRIFHIP